MKPKFRTLPAARADLLDQAQYLAQNASPDTVLRFVEAADSTFAFLASTPEAGVLWDKGVASVAELRLWRIKGFEKHRVFYRVTEGAIEIVRVLHGHRDIDEAFGRTGGQWAGKVSIAEDFDRLPAELAAAFGLTEDDET